MCAFVLFFHNSPRSLLGCAQCIARVPAIRPGLLIRKLDSFSPGAPPVYTFRIATTPATKSSCWGVRSAGISRKPQGPGPRLPGAHDERFSVLVRELSAFRAYTRSPCCQCRRCFCSS
jgi:hypothetical protein